MQQNTRQIEAVVAQSAAQRKGRWKLLMVLAICAAPMIASYFTYYVIQPQSKTNYGTLLDPRYYPVPALQGTTLDGKPVALSAYQGKWLILMADTAACAVSCQSKLYAMRQLRLTQGKEMERIERVWLVTDDMPVDAGLLRDYPGMRVLRVNPMQARAWLPAEGNLGSAAEHLYMLDPLGNLMMRFPRNPDLNKVKKDLARLLKASSIG